MDRTGKNSEEQSKTSYIVKAVLLLIIIIGTGVAVVVLSRRRCGTSCSVAVAIDSVSGLHPATLDLALNPEFNLTLRVTSHSESRRCNACVEAGTYVEVSYRCVPLAASATATQRLCAEPRKSRDEPVVAKGTGVRLPGSMLDSLAADMRSGGEVFGVTLRQSGTGGGDHRDYVYDYVMVASCGGRRVGGAADDLRSRCVDDDVWYPRCPDHRVRRVKDRMRRFGSGQR